VHIISFSANYPADLLGIERATALRLPRQWHINDEVSASSSTNST